MATITFENGQSVNFEGTPTPQDVEEVALKLGIKKQDKNNMLQKFAQNVLVRPATRVGQVIGTGITKGIEAFQSPEQRVITESNLQNALSKDIDRGLLGTTQAQQPFGQGGGKQILLEGGKSVLDIGTLGAGSAVNAGLRAGGTKLLTPLAEKVTESTAPQAIKTATNFVAKNLPKLGANVLEGEAYNTAYNALNEKPLTENAGTVGVLSAGLPIVGAAISRGYKSLTNPQNSANIMNRVARLNPLDAQKFKQIAGKTHGEYLSETGNFASPEKIIQNEFDKFQNSKQSVDDALSTLKGTYKTAPLQTMADDLYNRELRVSSEGAPSPDLVKSIELKSKLESEGLTMAETNELKRIYERNVRLGYLKDNNSEAIARATNIDNAVRNWQFKTADELGLKNLPELNKQTQISKFIVDKLGKKLLSKSGNNMVSLTDWILLSGGHPASIAGLVGKKIFGNKEVQAKIAKLVSKKTPKGVITPVYERQANQAQTMKNSTINPISKTIQNTPKKSNVLLDKFKNLPNKQGGFVTDIGYKNTGELTTKILKDLEGKTTVSKQYILDATNRGELKQVERDITRQVLGTMKGDTINVKEFADKVKAELLPLKVKSTSNPKTSDFWENKALTSGDGIDKGVRMKPRHENISLPDELKGNVKNYKENIYESPIKTSAGSNHFQGSSDSYFGHTRIEDMADNKTRRVIEVQSDLYQKGNLERELSFNEQFPKYKKGETLKVGDKTYKVLEANKDEAVKVFDGKEEKYINLRADEIAKELNPRKTEVAKLQQYNDPTAHFRMIREEIKKASQDGKTKLQFPTGETAMKIEGLGQTDSWLTKVKNSNGIMQGKKITPEDLKVGMEIAQQGHSSDWIITDVLGDTGKFKAIPKDKLMKDFKSQFPKISEEEITDFIKNCL